VTEGISNIEQGMLNNEVDSVPLPFDNAQDRAGMTKAGWGISELLPVLSLVNLKVSWF